MKHFVSAVSLPPSYCTWNSTSLVTLIFLQQLTFNFFSFPLFLNYRNEPVTTSTLYQAFRWAMPTGTGLCIKSGTQEGYKGWLQIQGLSEQLTLCFWKKAKIRPRIEFSGRVHMLRPWLQSSILKTNKHTKTKTNGHDEYLQVIFP